MRYSVLHLFVLMLLAVGLTAGALAGLLYGLIPTLSHALGWTGVAYAVHAFFFERTAIQWCTLCVFVFALTLLADQVLRRIGLERSLAAWSGQESYRPSAGSVLQRRVQAVETALCSAGVDAAVQCEEDMADRAADDLEQIYSLLGSAVQVMLALGFFGTVWGISRTMFGAFTSLDQGASLEAVRGGLRQFTQALSIALDTTVLGLVCGILISIVVTAARWADLDTLRRLTDVIRERFRLPLRPSGHGEGLGRLSADLSAIAVSSGQAMQEFAAHAIRTCGDALSAEAESKLEAFRTELAKARQDFGNSIAAAVKGFDERLCEVVQAVEQQTSRIETRIGADLTRIEQGLSAPPEISIRYPPKIAERSDGHKNSRGDQDTRVSLNAGS